ncbi:MAG: hypothetical protein QOI74_754 [Micromonosporaceae bacterium]|nr:hypothetical protein [Micromonosporaceae bacterium]
MTGRGDGTAGSGSSGRGTGDVRGRGAVYAGRSWAANRTADRTVGADRTDGTGRVDRANRADRTDGTGRVDRGDRADRPNPADHARATARPGQAATRAAKPAPGVGSSGRAGTRTPGLSRGGAAVDKPATGPGRHGPGLRLTHRGRRLVIILGAALAAVVVVVGIGGYVLFNRLPGSVARVNGTFEGINDAQRPAKLPVAKNSVTFLLVGSDSRDTGPTTGTAAQETEFRTGNRTDTIMLLNLPADGRSAAVVSIPRDSWVDIPGHGRMKINAAFALGGPPLLIRTVEQLTKVRIDHFAAIDFYGFRSIIDAIGGIDVQVPQSTTDIGGSGQSFPRGMNHLNGGRALAYVRQRHGLPAGDFDRVKRQQNMLRAVMTKIGTVDPATDPVKAYKLLNAVTKAVSVDSGLSDADLRNLAFSMRGLSARSVSFLTAPVTGTGMEGDQSVVYLDKVGCDQLWTAINNDRMPAYVTAHRADLLPAVTR